jgi:hypothetical protein
MKKILLASSMAILMGSVFLTSCSKDDDNNNTAGKATVNMHLTDGPADYDAIYLDIQSVEVTMAGSNAVTLTPINPGLYDILEFSNGMDTLLLKASLPAGTINQIRLILGPNSSIVVNGVTHPLNTPSAQESGVKLNLNQTLVANGAYDFWIDFDASKSILQTGNGTYKLKPVVRAYSALTNGMIKGYALPLAALTTVYAINGLDTFSAIPDPINGYFLISGLPAGSYNVLLDAGVLPFTDSMINNVSVTYGNQTDLGTITLQ